MTVEPPAPVPSLPSCVEIVRGAADRLHDAVLKTPFPDLDFNPKDSTELEILIDRIYEWGLAVCTAYGETSSSTEFPNGLLSLLSRPSGRHVRITFDRPGSGDSTDAWIVPLPSAGSLDSAADVLGDPPDHLLDSCARFWPAVVGALVKKPGTIRFLAVRWGTRPRQVTMENWPNLRGMVRERYQVAMCKSLELVAWVRQRIVALEQAVFPDVDDVGPGKRHSRMLEIRQAGSTRLVEVTSGQAMFLRELAGKGVARLDRSMKHDLVQRLPELTPWLQKAGGPTPGLSGGTYRVPDALRHRLKLKR